ncbi:MAG TPA: hypothetical protein VMM15_04030 [Bradyrhizobium sp.]|nr:hypothetical protein [Bradyrhizobium sp.]
MRSNCLSGMRCCSDRIPWIDVFGVTFMDEAEIDVHPRGPTETDLNAAVAASGFYNTAVTRPDMIRAVTGQFLAVQPSKDHERMNLIPRHEIARAKILVENDVPIF